VPEAPADATNLWKSIADAMKTAKPAATTAACQN
jgi:hypothetical protein